MITKGELSQLAFDALAMTGALLDLSGSNEDKMLRLIETLALGMADDGILLGWKKSENGINPDATEESGISDAQARNFSVYASLKAAKMFGLPPSQELAMDANKAYSQLFPVELINRENNANMPVGAGGNRGWRYNRFQQGEDPVTIENDGNLGDLTI